MNSFNQWLQNEGFNTNEAVVFEKKIEDMGSGLISRKDINKVHSNVILEIPMSAVIFPRSSLDYLKSCSCIKNLTSWLKWINFDGLRILILFLFHEKIIGHKSKFCPYLSHIPQSYNNFLYFEDWELKFIPKSLLKTALCQREFFKSSLKSLELELNQIISHHHFSGDVESIFKWSYSAVNSRCVYCQTSNSLFASFSNHHVILVPFFDKFNHRFGYKAEIKSNNERGKIIVSTEKEYISGQQVFIDYGPHSNSGLITEYGFVCEDNPNELINNISAFRRLFKNQFINDAIGLLKTANILPAHFNEDLYFNISFDGFSYCSILLIEIVSRYLDGISVSAADVYLWDEDELRRKNKSLLLEVVEILESDLCENLNKLKSLLNCSDNMQIIIKFIKIRLNMLNKFKM